jgi:hypothetical protein
LPGTDGGILAAARWDPDGAGPKREVLVIGGGFSRAGRIAAKNIATYDPVTGEWGTIGTGLTGTVTAIAVAPWGELVVGGDLDSPAGNIARWTGTAWAPLGSGVNNAVQAITSVPGRGIVVGGNFSTAGGKSCGRIAAWDGVQWILLGNGVNGTVLALTTLPSGDVVAGGTFTQASGTASKYAARWDWQAWRSMGNSLTDVMYTLSTMPNGDVVGGGSKASSSSESTLMHRWDGNAWTAFGSMGGKAPLVNAMQGMPDGTVLVGGSEPWFNGDAWAGRFMTYRDSTWKSDYALDHSVHAIADMGDGSAVFAGSFTTSIHGMGSRITRWRDGEYTMLTQGPLGRTLTACKLSDGSYVVGGEFEGVPQGVRGIGRSNGVRWSAIGTGLIGRVEGVCELADGRIVAVGEFEVPEDANIRNMAAWDGSTWSGFGTSIPPLLSMAVLDGGEIVVGGDFDAIDGVEASSVAVWDGEGWSRVGEGVTGTVRAVHLAQDGHVVAGGAFVMVDGSQGNIARWNGVEWSAVGGGAQGPVEAIGEQGDGSIVIGGAFAKVGDVGASSIARWNGEAWHAIGQGLEWGVHGVACLSSGEILAGGAFTRVGNNSGSAYHIARWDGTAWSTFGNGMNAPVHSMSVCDNQDVLVTGEFTMTDQLITPYFSRWTTSGVPTMGQHPTDTFGEPGTTIEMRAAPASGYIGVTYAWYRNGVRLKNGTGGASTGGGVVNGSSGHLASPSNGVDTVLRIIGAKALDTGEYTVVFTNECGAVETRPAVLTIKCPADVDDSGSVTPADYAAFVALFEAGESAADIDRSGFIDTDDFDAFVREYQSGC